MDHPHQHHPPLLVGGKARAADVPGLLVLPVGPGRVRDRWQRAPVGGWSVLHELGWAGVVWAGVLFGAAFGWLERIAVRCHGEPYLLLVPFTWMVFLFVAFRYLAPGFHYSAVLLSFVWLVSRRAPRHAAVRRRDRVPGLGGYAVARPV